MEQLYNSISPICYQKLFSLNLQIKNLINKKCLWTLASLIIIIPIGFYTKFYSGPAADWVNNSLGGVFYEIFWCLVVVFLFQKTKSGTISLIVLIVTCILEFLQLWHPPVLECIRSNFIGGTILGSSFSWSDFLYYFIGSAIGWLWLTKINLY